MANLLDINDEAGQYPNSFYAAQNPAPRGFDALKGRISADVCIIGGGFTGMSAALHLARRGYSVALLEAQRIGFGASGRNGGQVGMGQRLDQEALEKMIGGTRARALWDISKESVDLVRTLCSEIKTPFHPGIIHAAHKRRYVADYEREAEHLQTRYGYDHIQFLDQIRLRDMVASPAYYGGTLDMGSGHIDPLAYALGLGVLAQEAGARIYERTRVTGFARGRKVVVRTDQGEVVADHAILACNGYLGGLEPKVGKYVMPINNFIVATESMTPSEQDALIKGGRAVADSKFVVNYFRFSTDGRLLFGGSESYGYRFPRDIAAKVRRPMRSIFPQIADIGIEYAWGGTLGITMNRMPHFTLLDNNIVSLSGYSGHGVAMASMGGKIAAEVIAGQTERFDIMAQVPSYGFPGGEHMRLPLLILAMLWYSLRDRF